MSGECGFLGKLVGVFLDCEKMVGDQFSEGIQSLKKVVESKQAQSKQQEIIPNVLGQLKTPN